LVRFVGKNTTAHVKTLILQFADTACVCVCAIN